MTDALPHGAYDQVVTHGLLARLAGLRTVTQPVEDAESAAILGQHLGRVAARRLAALPPEQRLAEANRMLSTLSEADVVAPGPEQLLAIARQEEPGVWRLLQTRPQVPLSSPALLTNSHADPKLGSELRAELATADGVDLLCAFVKWYGLRVLETELAERRERGVPLRVLTTTYMGATDRTALDRLVRDFGAEVKVNHETRSTRLHAKAWLFRRNSGFDTAYVGSSHLSRAALLDGLEWNVRLAGSHTPELLTKFTATFDSYWLDPAFGGQEPLWVEDVLVGPAGPMHDERCPYLRRTRPWQHRVVEAYEFPLELGALSSCCWSVDGSKTLASSSASGVTRSRLPCRSSVSRLYPGRRSKGAVGAPQVVELHCTPIAQAP